VFTSTSKPFALRLGGSSVSYLLLSRDLANKAPKSAGLQRIPSPSAALILRSLSAELPTHANTGLSLIETSVPLRPRNKLDSGREVAGLVEQGHLVLFRAERPLRAPLDLPMHPPSLPPGEARPELNQRPVDGRTAKRSVAARPRDDSDLDEGPQTLGFGKVDRPGREGLFKSIKSKNPSRHGFVYEYGRNAADFRHAKDCPRCGHARQVQVQGDVLDGKCGADAVLADGTLVQRKSYRRLSGLRAAIFRQVGSDLRRYARPNDPQARWKSGRGGISLNGAIEFQVDLDRLLRRPTPQPTSKAKDVTPVRYPIYTTEYILAWCAELEEDLNRQFGIVLNGKRPKIIVKALRAGQRECPFAGQNGGTEK